MILAIFMTVSFSSRAESVVDIIVNSPNHTILETALIEANFIDDLEGSGSFTVFAPTDAAFSALPEGTLEALLADSRGVLTQILLYHMVKGKVMSTDLSDGLIVDTYNDSDEKLTVTISEEGVFINNAKVTLADLEAENGVVHVIDAVLLPPTMPASVVDIIVNSENHTTLEAAVVAAGLVETLQGDGPFTVFAPTDAAFAALPAGTVESLLEDPTEPLTDILLYHVVSGKAMSTDLSDGQMIETVLGKDITVKITDEGVYINNAMVTVADLEAENGVVHVINAVLIPTITNISALKDISFEVYPNPASNYIKINSNVQNGSLNIRDIAGRVVTEMNNVNTNDRIDLRGFESGIYLVTMKNGKSFSTRKLIVQ